MWLSRSSCVYFYYLYVYNRGDRPIIHVPVKDIGNTEPDVFPMLDALDVTDRLILSLDPRFIATQNVVDALRNKMINRETVYFIDNHDPRNHGTDMNLQTVKKANPEVMLGGLDEAMELKGQYSKYIYWGSSDELTPFARSEWVEIMGILTGKTEAAQKLSDQIKASYNEIKATVTTAISNATTKPVIFKGTLINHRDGQSKETTKKWFMPGGNSDEAVLYSDAGGKYVLETTNSSDIMMDYDEGLRLLQQSDYWFDPNLCLTRTEELLGYNSDFGNVEAVKNYNTYVEIRRSGDDLCQKSDKLEGGVLYPDFLLRDIVNVLHPGVLSNTHLNYYSNIVPIQPGSKVTFGSPSTYPTNCEYGDWNDWEECSSNCGHGTQFRTRQIVTDSSSGGADCTHMFDVKDCVGGCKATINLTVLLICVCVIAFIIAIVIAWFVGRKTAKNIGSSLQSMKAEEKDVMIQQLAQGNYNTLA